MSGTLIRTLVAAGTSALLFGGCHSVKPLSQTVQPSAKDVVYVLGVAPENYQLTIWPGYIEKGMFKLDALSHSAVSSTPIDGYIVWTGAPNQALAVTGVQWPGNKADLPGGNFSPCGDQTTMVFKGGAGKVLYLGDVQYAVDGNQISIRSQDRFDRAARHINAQYPALRGKLEPAAMENYRLNTPPCGPAGYSPVYNNMPTPQGNK